MSYEDTDASLGDAGASQRRNRGRLAASRAGKPGPEPSPPKFSQPVRQIVLMLIVIGLVALGGWFAYGRILSIFAANRFLNGLILAVFVLGVLACLWQVAQLVNSVSWIERFAARRRNALESGINPSAELETDTAPRLLAPLAALLGARGPIGGVISTGSAQSILESVGQRVDEARDITRYLTNLLIFLGLLGTFYGLATTIPAVVDTIRTLSPKDGQTGIEVFDQLMSGLEAQLGGMATAFSSSLLGLAGSLVVGLLELFVTHGQNRFYRELEEWMSGFTRIGMAGGDSESVDHATIAGFLDQIALQMGQLQEFYARRDEMRDAESRAADARAVAMAAGVERLTSYVLSDSEATVARAAALTKAINRLADGQDRLIAQGEARLADEGDDPEVRMRLRSIDVQLGRVLEEGAASQAQMLADLRQDLSGLTRALQNLEPRDGA